MYVYSRGREKWWKGGECSIREECVYHRARALNHPSDYLTISLRVTNLQLRIQAKSISPLGPPSSPRGEYVRHLPGHRGYGNCVPWLIRNNGTDNLIPAFRFSRVSVSLIADWYSAGWFVESRFRFENRNETVISRYIAALCPSY